MKHIIIVSILSTILSLVAQNASADTSISTEKVLPYCEAMVKAIDTKDPDLVLKGSFCLGIVVGVTQTMQGLNEVCIVESTAPADIIKGLVSTLAAVKENDQASYADLAGIQMSVTIAGYLMSQYPCEVTLDSLPKGETF